MANDSVLWGADTMNAPWGLQSRLKLVALACHFFNANKTAESHAAIGRSLSAEGTPGPLTVLDFLKYLEINKTFSKTPNAMRVAEIVERMASAGLLACAGRGSSSIARLKDHYLYMPTVWEARRDLFRLVPALGPEYLFWLCTPGLVHITGRNKKGNAVAGTGLVVDPRHVLTCRHVVSDMEVDGTQKIQGSKYAVNDDSLYMHADIDVAVMRMNGPPLSPLKGALFQAPVVARTVYTLGYPKLPGLREASATIQQGAVTNEAVTSLAGEKLFLYSAISRPGNSGGPVMSDDGYVVGLSIVDATGRYDADDAFTPHYAGIPAQVVVEAVEDLGLGIELPFEQYE